MQVDPKQNIGTILMDTFRKTGHKHIKIALEDSQKKFKSHNMVKYSLNRLIMSPREAKIVSFGGVITLHLKKTILTVLVAFFFNFQPSL